MEGPKAPKDPEKKRKSFYILRGREISGSVQPDGSGIQYIFLNDGRMLSSARIVGNIENEEMLELLKTTEGFRKLVHSIGVSVEMENRNETVVFAFQMYGKKDIYRSGTTLRLPINADGRERILKLDECEWSSDDDIPGQLRFEFPCADELAVASVRLYLKDGFDAPEPEEENPVDFQSQDYRKMLEKSLVQTGNNARLKKAIDKARRGEDTTIAFIGGSITQGAGAVPIHTECYAYKAFRGFCELAGRGTEENIHYIKAGVGGTPSELGLVRYRRDVLREGEVQPDIVVVEFAVNDEGDETKGECYDSLVRKILNAENAPAVILLFAVFDNDWNLQERLSPVGRAYQLPMVSTRDAVVGQFYRKPGMGRVISKNQFFYDCFHPTNLGHTIMADGLIHLMHIVDGQEQMEDALRLSEVKPPLGGEFEKVEFMGRKSQPVIVENLDFGSFEGTDTVLQAVERDKDLFCTPEFPDNWMHTGGEVPFSMDITCTALLLVYMDSGSVESGCAEVLVDGEKVLSVNPRLVGWTHCNALICFRGRERRKYHVEVRMQKGEEEKNFTVLGFGYVE